MKYKHIVAIALFAFLTSCSPGKGKKLIFVLFDVSGSTISRREAYNNEFNKLILSSLKSGGRIIADRITDNPLAQSSFPVNFKILSYNPLGDETEREDKNQFERDLATTTIANLLSSSNRRIMRTKIFDSLKLAERVFNSYPEYKKRILVIFSDMIEESDEYNFKRDVLDDSKIKKIIEEQKQSKSGLPNLTGVRVYITGATATSKGGLTTDRINAIKNFWISYYSTCGADVIDYGPTLLRFEE